MSADWSALTRSRKWIPIQDLGIDFSKVVDGIAQLDGNTFAVVVPHDADFRPAAPNAAFVSAVLRAPDLSGARRALLLELEGDAARTLGELPAELAAGNLTYRGLIDHAAQSSQPAREFAIYRAASDGAFIQRAVEHGNLTYYFRDPGEPSDRAYAILCSLPRTAERS